MAPVKMQCCAATKSGERCSFKTVMTFLDGKYSFCGKHESVADLSHDDLVARVHVTCKDGYVLSIVEPATTEDDTTELRDKLAAVQDAVSELADAITKLEVESSAESAPSAVSGKTIVFAGVSDERLTDLIKKHGGFVRQKVTGKTNTLVLRDQDHHPKPYRDACDLIEQGKNPDLLIVSLQEFLEQHPYLAAA